MPSRAKVAGSLKDVAQAILRSPFAPEIALLNRAFQRPPERRLRPPHIPERKQRISQHPCRLGMFRLRLQGLPVKQHRLPNIPQQRQIRHVPRRLRAPPPRLGQHPRLRLEFPLESVFRRPRVPPRQRRKRLRQTRPLPDRSPGQLARQLLDSPAQPLDLSRLQMPRLFQLRDPHLRHPNVPQQRIEIRHRNQPRLRANLRDQPARVILPPILGDTASIPDLKQRPQHRRQSRTVWHPGAFHQSRRDCHLPTSQCLHQFVADHVAVILVKPAQILRVSPSRTDHRHADGTARQSRLDLVPPLPHTNTVDIAEHVILPKGDS